MYIYRITYTRGYNQNEESKTIFASDVQQALDDFRRFARKNWYSDVVILKAEREGKVDIFYKSRERIKPKHAKRKR